MPTALLRVTNGPRLITSDQMVDEQIVPGKDELVEVLGYRAMRLTLNVRSLKAGGPRPSFALVMDTGMNREEPEGFVSLGVFDPLGTAPAMLQRVFTDLQRYVRWRIIAFDNIDSLEISIEGVVYD